MTKERRSKTDKLRRKNEELFVGREEPIQRFRRHLESKPDDDDFIDIYNIYGQGGVGKSYLCQKLLGMAKAKNALTTYTDEGVKSVVEWMGAVAKQPGSARLATSGRTRTSTVSSASSGGASSSTQSSTSAPSATLSEGAAV